METRSANNGILFTLTNTQRNLRRENSTRTSVFTLRETSMLSLTYHNTDTLRLSTIEIWLSRLQMEIRVKFSTSIKNPRPLSQESITNLGISRALERLLNYKSGAPTQDGGNCSDMREDSSPTCGTTEFSMSSKQKMLNIKR